MGVPYSIFCCFKSTTNARLIDLESGGGGTYSTDVNTMLASADNAGIRTSIGLGTASSPTFTNLFLGPNGAKITADLGGGGRMAIGSTATTNRLIVGDGGGNYTGVYGLIIGMPGSYADSYLLSEGNNVLVQKNQNSSQVFRLYNGTDVMIGNPTNFDRASFSFTSGNFRIAAEYSNTGAYTTARGIDFVTGGAVRMSIAAAGLVTIDSIPFSRGIGTNSNNIAIGSGLSSNTSGTTNTVVGASALFSNTSGGSNAAFGTGSLYSTTFGGGNSAIGVYSLYGNISGAFNSAIGVNAGRFIADGTSANTNTLNSIYIGAQAKALADGQTNQIVIGYDATGLGSNSVVLGNASITTTALRGNVGIGVSNPVADLDIAETWNAPALAVTAGSANGVTTILNFATQLTAIPVGSTIVVAGVNPAGYNGTFVVTSSATNAVAYASTNNATYVTGGTIERLFTSVKLNVTATAANAASRLLDLQIGGTSRMRVGIEGGVFSQNSSDTGGLFSAGSNGFKTIQFGGSLFTSNGMAAIRDPGTVAVRDSGGFCWVDASQNPATGPIELGLFKDAAGILAQRNGTAAQAFRVYNTFPGTTANEWFEITWQPTGTNAVSLGVNKGATGVRRSMNLTLEGQAVFGISKDGGGSGAWWSIATSGHILCNVDNAYDIGASGANRPRNLYVAGNAVFGTNTGVSTATPLNVSFGGTYGTAVPGSDSNLKWDMYNSGSGDRYGIGMSIYLMEFQAGIGAGFGFYPNSGTTSALHILSTGNVGIGTTTPASKLQVTAGDIEVETVTNGIILKAAGTSTRYRLTLNAGGTALVFTAV